MFTDLVFLLRDTAPTLFDLGIAVGATAGLAAVCTFLLNALLRRFTSPALLGLVAVAVVSSLPSSSSALDLRWHVPSVSIAASETVNAWAGVG